MHGFDFVTKDEELRGMIMRGGERSSIRALIVVSDGWCQLQVLCGITPCFPFLETVPKITGNTLHRSHLPQPCLRVKTCATPRRDPLATALGTYQPSSRVRPYPDA